MEGPDKREHKEDLPAAIPAAEKNTLGLDEPKKIGSIVNNGDSLQDAIKLAVLSAITTNGAGRLNIPSTNDAYNNYPEKLIEMTKNPMRENPKINTILPDRRRAVLSDNEGDVEVNPDKVELVLDDAPRDENPFPNTPPTPP